MFGPIFNLFLHHYNTFGFNSLFSLFCRMLSLSGTERLEQSHVYVLGPGQSSLVPLLPFCAVLRM